MTGMPGAGKSTVTGLAARRMPRAVQLNGDTVNEMIVSGRVPFQAEPALEAAAQVDLCNRNLCALAMNFADAGFTAFIDWIIPTRQQLDLFVGLLAPRDVMLVVLAPGIKVCESRNTTRGPAEAWHFDGYEKLDAEMRRELGQIGWWFDTSALSPDAAAEQIVSETLHRATVPPPGEGGTSL